MSRTLAIESASQPATKRSMDGQSNRLQDRIEQRAYELYEARGRTPGHQEDDWYKAESEILAQGQSPRAA